MRKYKCTINNNLLCMKRDEDILFGCDPEFFFKHKGNIVGSEKVIPPRLEVSNGGTITRDGVQAEINLEPVDNESDMAVKLKNIFGALIDLVPKGVEIDFTNTVEVTEQEIQSLSPESKQFGCMPSYNIYGEDPVRDADATKYLKRSAGGHIHIGSKNPDKVKKMQDEAPRLVMLLDILVGNTAVLLDRDMGNLERRKNYGRAGEYRLPKHGVEYRTPSNFWIKDVEYMSFMLGAVRTAVEIFLAGRDVELFKILNIKTERNDVREAINTNDFALAQKNLRKIEPWLWDNVQSGPLSQDGLVAFYLLVAENSSNRTEGIAEYWKELESSVQGGFDYIAKIISSRIKRSTK